MELGLNGYGWCGIDCHNSAHSQGHIILDQGSAARDKRLVLGGKSQYILRPWRTAKVIFQLLAQDSLTPLE